MGYFRDGFDGSQDYDLILRATEKARNIVHIPKILYHCRISSASAAASPLAKPYTGESSKKVLAEHIKRTGLKGQIEDAQFLNTYKIK